jgi:hypothetical protein
VPVVAVVSGAGGADVAWAVAIAFVVVFRHRVNFVRWWGARSSTDSR